MNHNLPNFQHLALQYAQAQTETEKENINQQAKKLMEEYILQDNSKSRIEDIYLLMQKDMLWIKALIEKNNFSETQDTEKV